MGIWIEIFCIEAIWIYLLPTHNQQHIFQFMVKSWHKHTLAHRFTHVCVCAYAYVCICVYYPQYTPIHTNLLPWANTFGIFFIYISSVYDPRLVVDIPIISRWGILNASRTRKRAKDSCGGLTFTPKVQICRGHRWFRLLSIFQGKWNHRMLVTWWRLSTSIFLWSLYSELNSNHSRAEGKQW